MAGKFGVIVFCLLENHWLKSFYDALEHHDVYGFLCQIGVFLGISLGLIVSGTLASWFNIDLKLRWRDWLTRHYMADWLNAAHTSYRVQVSQSVPNPDQRIAEDLAHYIDHTLDLITGVLDVTTSLILFSVVLWNLSGMVTVWGVAVPGTLVLAAFLWTILGSVFAHWIGKPLRDLYAVRANQEGDFRFSMMRAREHAESIALYRGEERECKLALRRWAIALGTMWTTVHIERTLGIFVGSFGRFGIILPFLLVAPRFFSGSISFGEVMQIVAAFGSARHCLDWFIGSYGQIAYWRADTERVRQFRAELDRPAPDNALQIVSGGAYLDLALRVSKPSGETLIEDLRVVAHPGEAILLQGASGTGKSTTFEAVAGLCPHAAGRAVLGGTRPFFVPQQSYLPVGTLRDALLYPEAKAGMDAEGALRAVGLAALIPQLDVAEDWSMRLSGGEQQRVAFARLVLAEPDVIFLDEATSALDEASEAHLYGVLRGMAHRPIIVSIGHRASLAGYHDRVVSIAP